MISCDKNSDDPKKITITNGKTEQTFYADQTSMNEGNGIRFTATGKWTATVTETTTKAAAQDRVDWLLLSAYEGGAGEFTLTMTLQPNTTGSDRTATISIVCGETKITINVEQKGTIASGEVLEPGKTYYTLSTFPEDGTTLQYDTWVITDSGAPSVEEFASLKKAVYSAGRAITLEFSNMEKIPDKFIADNDSEDNLQNVTNVKAIKAPKLKSAGLGAFAKFVKLESVDMPLLESVGASAFAFCSSLKSISLAQLTTVTSATFSACTSLTTVDLPEVLKVGMLDFNGCSSLTKVSVDKAKEIEWSGFMNCSNLESILFKQVEKIGMSVFSGCSKLNELEFGQSVEVNSMAFMGVTLSNIDLIVSLLDEKVVDSNAKTWNGYGPFKSVTLRTSR